jgi:plasmid maintenance system antidote protein VapI
VSITVNEMLSNLSIIKGIHPGLILERELKRRKLQKGSFARSINEFPQTIASICKTKRRINPALSLKIEQALGIEEGYFMVLQAYFDIEQEKKRLSLNCKPDLSKFRPILFWDTNFEKIDWNKNKMAIVKRVFERGNELEINEVIRFYSKELLLKLLNKTFSYQDEILKENVQKYLH